MKKGIYLEQVNQFWIIRKSNMYLTDDQDLGIIWTRYFEDALLFTSEDHAKRYRTKHKLA